MTDHTHHFEPFHDAPDTDACTVCGIERPAFGGDRWYSDRALAKQAALADKAPGEASWTDIIGIWEPRTQPTDGERCHQCGGDARGGAGGDGHFCGLHVGRDYAAPNDCPDDCDRAALRPAFGGGA